MPKRALRNSPRASAIPWLCLAAIVVLSSVIGLRAMKAPKIDFGDGLDYLAAAYHLRHDHTFSQAATVDPTPPALGREPGYAAALAALMALDPGVGSYRPSCAALEPPCDPMRFRAIGLPEPRMHRSGRRAGLPAGATPHGTRVAGARGGHRISCST